MRIILIYTDSFCGDFETIYKFFETKESMINFVNTELSNRKNDIEILYVGTTEEMKIKPVSYVEKYEICE